MKIVSLVQTADRRFVEIGGLTSNHRGNSDSCGPLVCGAVAAAVKSVATHCVSAGPQRADTARSFRSVRRRYPVGGSYSSSLVSMWKIDTSSLRPVATRATFSGLFFW